MVRNKLYEKMREIEVYEPNQDVWCLWTGSWRNIVPEIESDMYIAGRLILNRGYGIVTGGALGADEYITRLVLKYKDKSKRLSDQLRIILPSTYNDYLSYIASKCDQPENNRTISRDQAERLTDLLREVDRIDSNVISFRSRGDLINKKIYYDRNTDEVERSNRIIAFHVNESPGVQDTIDKGIEKGIPIIIFGYKVDEEYGQLLEEYSLFYNLPEKPKYKNTVYLRKKFKSE